MSCWRRQGVSNYVERDLDLHALSAFRTRAMQGICGASLSEVVGTAVQQ